MNVVLLRVDDRFIHGQILESWIPFLRAQGIIVANDELANDQFQKAIMSMAIPERINLRIVPVEIVSRVLSAKEFSDKPTLIIVSSIKDASRLYQNGLAFTKLNIGNMKARDGSRQVSFSAWVDSEDIELLKDFIARGVYVNLQSVPRERDIDMRTIIEMVDL
ncbi:MAG: PTS sugar transporter subunit IIB [Deltaproteobacteria bacterium]|nr:PTS sugar transporter subunit IIB [Deltaproteobacteria bacterium]